jgi:cytoskeletal protein RodZ
MVKKIVIIGVVLVVIAISSVIVYNIWFNTGSSELGESTTEQNDSYDANQPSDAKQNVPSSSDKESDTNSKEQNATSDGSDNSLAPTNSIHDISADMSMTHADFERGGIAAGAIIEGIANSSDATCTITVSSQSGEKVQNSAKPEFDSRTISCVEGMFIPATQLQSGAWSVEISYANTLYAGTVKSSKTVQVP